MGLFSRRVPVHVPMDDDSVRRIARALYNAHGSVEKVRSAMQWAGPDHPDDKELVAAEVARLVKASKEK
jgi:hypothetical protein